MTAVAARIRDVWQALTTDQRMAAAAALALLVSMILPWYAVTTNVVVRGQLQTQSDTRAALEVYSFVEAAILVVAAGVLALLYARGQRKAFHLPGGDGSVILAAGGWVMFLVFYRQLDKPDVEGLAGTTVGVTWGIFIAFLLGTLMAYAGLRIRAAHTPEPPVDGARPRRRPDSPEPPPAPAPPDSAPTALAPRRREPRPPDGQLSLDDPTQRPSERA